MQYFLLHCFKPFKGPIPVECHFNYQGKPFTLHLYLPIAITTFIVPTTLDASQFVTAWSKYTNEVIVMRKMDTVVDINKLQQQVQQALHMYIVPNVEKTNDNFVCVGTFHTATKSANGAYVTMPAMARFETKPGVPMFRLTVHSGHQSVSDALVNAITTVLAAKE